jgi:hypothetical protein
VDIQKIRWGNGGTVRAGVYTLFYGKGNKSPSTETGVFVHHKILSAVKRAEVVSDRMSYIVLGGRLCQILL